MISRLGSEEADAVKRAQDLPLLAHRGKDSSRDPSAVALLSDTFTDSLTLPLCSFLLSV